MTARHAGPSRIADTALLDQVKAAVAEMRTHLAAPPLSDPGWSLHAWAGRAMYLLEEIGRLSE
jgi:hypothetical protein